MVSLSRPYYFRIFNNCLTHILLGPFLNTLTHIKTKSIIREGFYCLMILLLTWVAICLQKIVRHTNSLIPSSDHFSSYIESRSLFSSIARHILPAILTLWAPTQQNGPTHSNNSSAIRDHFVGLTLKVLSQPGAMNNDGRIFMCFSEYSSVFTDDIWRS